MIESGSLSVSSVSKVQTHLKQEMKEGIRRKATEKLELFQAMQNCTSREVEVKLAGVRGEVLKEKLVIEMDEELSALWTQVKNLAAHRSGGDPAEALRIITSEWLSKNDPAREKVQKQPLEKTRAVARKSPILRRAVPLLCRNQETLKERSFTMKEPLLASHPVSHPASHSTTRYIPAAIRREIWKRDARKCTRCRSTYALEIALLSGLKPIMLATAQVQDDEMRERVAAHKLERGPQWELFEEPLALANALRQLARPHHIVVVDCLTLWLSNLMMEAQDIAQRTRELATEVTNIGGPVVLVSNELGLGTVPDHALTRKFRDAQGRLNQAMAQACDKVVFVQVGLPQVLKPAAPVSFKF